MAGVDPALERARITLLRRVSRLIDELDDEDLAASLRRIAPRLVAAMLQGRLAALDAVTGRAADQLAAEIGVDLGWDFLDREQWIGKTARAEYSARIQSAADSVETAVRAGANPVEQSTWLRYWQMQIAGSEVHQTARDATMQVAGNAPTGGRVMRVAETGACEWCLTQSSRGPVFHSDATALAVSHGHCRCDIVTVTSPAAIATIRDAGAEAWQRSSLSAQSNPFTPRTRTGTRRSSKPDPALFRPGAGTPERLVSARAQLTAYEQTLAAGNGSDWMRSQVTALRLELADPVRG